MYQDLVTGLYLDHARDYSAWQGRFLTRDPAGEDGGLNLYVYCQNDPVNEVDPSGLGPRMEVSAQAAGPNKERTDIGIYRVWDSGQRERIGTYVKLSDGTWAVRMEVPGEDVYGHYFDKDVVEQFIGLDDWENNDFMKKDRNVGATAPNGPGLMNAVRFRNAQDSQVKKANFANNHATSPGRR